MIFVVSICNRDASRNFLPSVVSALPGRAWLDVGSTEGGAFRAEASALA